jgi:ferredoxin
MKVRIERDLCIGSGTCVRLAPGTFELGQDDLAFVIDPSAADDAELERAADSCPAGAIFLDAPAGNA